MKSIKRTFLCVALSLITVLSCLFYGAASTAKKNVQKLEPLAITDPAAYISVAQNDSFKLYFCDLNGAIRVENKNGKVWNSAVTEDVFDTSLSTDTFKAYMNSLIAINYCKKDDNSGNCIKDYASHLSNIRTVYSCQNGIAVKCFFSIPKISVTVYITLTDSGISVNIPQDEIEEKDEYILYSIEVLPFFGAAAQNDEGYLFYPDGSGAITEFSTSMDKSRFTDELVLDVYSALDDNRLLSDNIRTVMLPVYGIKRNDTAFLAAADAGDENLSIHVSPCIPMSLLSVNRSYFEFKYRGEYRVYVSNSVKGNQDADKLQYKQKIDKTMIKGDRTVNLFLLDGENADYSSMAGVYREHLVKCGKLNNQSSNSAQKLSLEIYMAVDDPDALFEGKVVATDFKEAEKIIEGYLQSGVEKLDVRLKGWSADGGKYPQKAQISSEAGGKKGLKSLNELAKKYKNRLSITLHSDAIHTSKKNSASLMGNLIPVTDEDKEVFLTTPEKALKNLDKFFKVAQKYSDIGIAADGVGRIVYNDYKKSRRYNRADTVNGFKNALNNSEIGAVQGGNLYTLANASLLYDIPIKSSGYPLTDYSIPFYQMVIHGCISYSADMAGNLSSDLKREALMWVEYGCTPYFVITEADPSVLAGTSANTIFSSQNSEWKKSIVEIYGEFAERLSSVADKKIIKHERVSDSLSALRFEDGTTVVINYGDKTAEYNGIKAEPQDFAVKGGGK